MKHKVSLEGYIDCANIDIKEETKHEKNTIFDGSINYHGPIIAAVCV